MRAPARPAGDRGRAHQVLPGRPAIVQTASQHHLGGQLPRRPGRQDPARRTAADGRGRPRRPAERRRSQRMTRDVIKRDLAVVGGGPVGLYAAYYAGFRGLSAVIIDSLPEPGGQVSAMYPEKPIYDVAGFPAIKGRDLVAGLVAQAARFSPAYLLHPRSLQLDRHGDGTIEISTDKGTTIRAKAVVISGGIGTFTPRPLPTGEEWIGRGLALCVPSLQDHGGQDVVVVGGGDSACDWALSLEPMALSVTLVHRRTAFRAHAHTVEQLHRSSVNVITNAEVSKVQGTERVETVEITATDGTTVIRPAQAVIAALGFTANLGPIRSWGVDLVGNRYIPVATTMSTNFPGVFAAGALT